MGDRADGADCEIRPVGSVALSGLNSSRRTCTQGSRPGLLSVAPSGLPFPDTQHSALFTQHFSPLPSPMPRRKSLVILSQTFVPDPAAVGQYMTEVAVAMARRGHRVRAYASARGYEDASRRYPLREDLDGVDVRRLDFASFGKRHLALRVLGTASFMAQVFFRVMTERNLGGIFFSTSPPLVGFVAAIAGWLRGVPVAYWAMDLNPDQLIALGKLKATDPAARLLEAVNRFILRRSKLVVALDRFMADRLKRRADLDGKLLVVPPWPQEEELRAAAPSVGGTDMSTRPCPGPADTASESHGHEYMSVPPNQGDAGGTPAPQQGTSWPADRDANPFRLAHGLAGKFVVMYSGNHSPSNPLDTLLAATLRFRDDPTLVFAFVGGGTGKKAVEAHVAEHKLANVLCLPYQPLANLKHSLSAADVHVVSLGGEMVGIIHPCKVYGAMAVGRPILYLGPRPSHVTDLLDRSDFGRAVAHGDVDGCAAAVAALRDTPPAELARMGAVARAALAESLSQQALADRFCEALERALRLG